MSPNDLRMLCTALGFTAVVIKGNDQHKDKAQRARIFAGLIEDFCHESLAPVNENENDLIDEMIEQIKHGLRDRGQADMHYDRRTLLDLYDRLRQRYAAFADDDQLADRVLELIDAELERRDDSVRE